MPELPATKVCPMCAETIQSAAKLCPHCRHWQSKWSLAHPSVGAGLTLVILLIGFGGFVALVGKVLGPKRDFAQFRDEISVLNSSYSHQTSGTNLLVVVVGTLTNKSDFSWKVFSMEARFFDSKGKLIDVASRLGRYDDFVLMPRGEAAFKIEGRTVRPRSDYASHQVSVLWAKDVREWP